MASSSPNSKAPPLQSLAQLPRLSSGFTLIDSHCHLDEDRFEHDREEVISRSVAAGVATMITIGAGGAMRCNHEAVALAARHAAVFATVGIHPHDAKAMTDDTLAELERLAKQPKVVAIGETGLDYYYDNSPRQQQEDAFRRSIDLARHLGLPISIHLRDAYNDAARILREQRAAEVGGVLHCFSAGPPEARMFLDLGFHLSFSGIVTFRKSDDIRGAARLTPIDRLLIETDAPFLAPAPFRGRRNEPALALWTAQAMAEVRGVSLDALAEQTSANTTACFRFSPVPGS